MGSIVNSGMYRHDRVGLFKVTVRSNARRVIGRYKEGLWHITVPYGIERHKLMSIVGTWEQTRDTVDETTCQPFYRIGQQIELDYFTVVIEREDKIADKVISRYEDGEYHVAIGSRIDMNNPALWKTITRAIEDIAQALAPETLIEEARAIAKKVGVRPTGWTIGRGRRVLGTCNARGIITLSRVLMFMPADLRRYVISHELAHLSELNHSSRFHTLCDSYLDGREKELQVKLKSFRWPLYY